MPAWLRTRDWSGGVINAYRNHILQRCRDIFSGQEQWTCSEFCAKLVIEFAKGFGLPVVLEGFAKVGGTTSYKVFDSSNNEWGDWAAFAKAVFAGIQANEIAGGPKENFGNSFLISVNDLKAGDMLAHRSAAPPGSSRHGLFGHLQMVAYSTLKASLFSGPPSSGVAAIFQGNAEFHLFSTTPEPVQLGSYEWNEGRFWYRREGQPAVDGIQMWNDRNITPIRWNFNQFNKGTEAVPDPSLE